MAPVSQMVGPWGRRDRYPGCRRPQEMQNLSSFRSRLGPIPGPHSNSGTQVLTTFHEPPTILHHTLSYYTILYYKIPYRTILHSTLFYSILLYSTLLYSALVYSTLLYSTLLYSTLLYSTSTLLYSTLLYGTTKSHEPPSIPEFRDPDS